MAPRRLGQSGRLEGGRDWDEHEWDSICTQAGDARGSAGARWRGVQQTAGGWGLWCSVACPPNTTAVGRLWGGAGAATSGQQRKGATRG